MFPPESEGLDMGQILQQAQRMQEQLMSAQQDLTGTEATGTAGGGLVSATVTGGGALTALRIDPSVVDPDDVETLSDLIIAAVRDAHAEIQRKAEQQLGSINAEVEGLLGGMGGTNSLAALFGGGSAEAISESPERQDDAPEHEGAGPEHEDDDGSGQTSRAPGS